MNINTRLKLSDDALDQVVGGAGNIGVKGGAFEPRQLVCPNPRCESHNTKSLKYDNNLAWFDIYGGGRGKCRVCGKERYDL